MVVRLMLLLLPVHTLLRVHPNQRILCRAPGSSMLRLLVHPSIPTSKSLPVGGSRSATFKAAGEDYGTTGMRPSLVGTIAKVNTGRRRLERGGGTLVGGRGGRTVRTDASTWSKECLRRLLLLLLLLVVVVVVLRRRLLLVGRLAFPQGTGSGRYLPVRTEEVVGRRGIANYLVRPQPLAAGR